MRTKIRSLVKSNIFNNIIMSIVIIDMMFMGLDEIYTSSTIKLIQQTITYIYILELALRWIGSENTDKFKQDKRNLFDLAIIALRIIPETGPLALLKLYRSTMVMSVLRKIKVSIDHVINKFYLQNVKQLNY